LARTTITSLTTWIVLWSLFIFGGDVIRSFVAAMIFGIAIGTYSSIFIAAPVLIYMRVRGDQFDKGGETAAEGTARTPAAAPSARETKPAPQK
jgi:preprotein translocase subunit SecF